MHLAKLMLVRAHVRNQLQDEGVSFKRAIRLSNLVNDGVLSSALSLAPQEVQTKFTQLEQSVIAEGSTGAFGDGSLIKLFTDFLSSDLGKQLIDIIMKLILGGI